MILLHNLLLIKCCFKQIVVEAPDEGKPSKNRVWWSESTRNFLCIVV